MKQLDLQNVEISASFSFNHEETGINISGACTVDNHDRKVKALNGAVKDGDTVIGSVAAHSNNGNKTYVIQPYDMADGIRIITACTELFNEIEAYDYSNQPVAEEGAEA